MIRRAQNLQDVRTIVDFQLSMALETEDLTLEKETLTKGVTRVIEDPIKGNYWIKEVNGEAIACMLTLTEWSDWRNKDVCWIHSVFVKKEFRKQGHFKSMFKFLKEKTGAEKEFAGLRLYVDQSNKPAIQVYKSLNFKDEHYALFEYFPE